MSSGARVPGAPLLKGTEMDSKKEPSNESQQDVARKRHYKKPHLEIYGKLLSLTLGGSPGIQDTGDPFATRPPG